MSGIGSKQQGRVIKTLHAACLTGPFLLLATLFPVNVSFGAEPLLDVTEAYLGNADFTVDIHNKATRGTDFFGDDGTFDEVAGWDREKDGWGVGATYAYGHEHTLHGKAVPDTDPDGNAEGAALGIVNAWGGWVKYSQAVTLPAGSYEIHYAAFNANSGVNTINYSGFVTSGGSETLSTVNSFPSMQWTEYTVSFTLAEETEGIIQLGLGSAISGSADKAGLFFDRVEIHSSVDDLGTYKGKLTALTDEAQQMYDAGGFYLPLGDALASALQAADTAQGSSLLDDVLAAMGGLSRAMLELEPELEDYTRLAAYIDEINVAINTYGRSDLEAYRDTLQAAYDDQTWDADRIDTEIARKESLFFTVELERTAEKKYKIKQRIDVELVESSFPVGYCQVLVSNLHFIAYYDNDKNMCVGYRTLDEASFTKTTLNSKVGWDSHNYITMIVDDEGYIHISGNMHNVQLNYWRSTNPYDASEFQALHSMVGTLEDNTTYPKFLKTQSGDLLFHYRYGWSGNGYEVYNIWDPETQTWSRFLDEALIDGEGARNAYMRGPYYEADGYYHLYWVWRETPDAATNHDFSYARSTNLINWVTASGVAVARPMVFGESRLMVDPSPAMSGTGILNGVQAHTMDSQNRIVLANMKYDELGNTQFYVYRLKEDGTWEEKRVTNWLYRFQFGGGGSLVFEVNMKGMRNLGNGELGISYVHSQYGTGEIILDEETLEPKTIREFAYSYPEELNEVTTAGTYSKEVEVKISQSGNYILRWETLGANNDQQPTGTLPPDYMLQMIELEPILANAGFEDPVTGSVTNNPADAGWTFSADSGIAADGGALTSGNDNAPEGSQVAFLRGNGTITQTLSDLTPGTGYNITFIASQRQNIAQPGQTFNVVVDGIVMGSFEPSQGSAGYTNLFAGFTAGATSHTLSFVGTNLNGGDNTVFIDDVRLMIANRPAEFSADPISGSVATEGAAYSGSLADHATDSDGDTLIFSKVSGHAWLNVAADGTLSGTPTSRDLGSNSFTLEVTDGNGATDSATLNILVYSSVQGNVANYGFETPETDSFVYNPTGAGWTFSSSGVSANGSGFTAGNDNAPEGDQVAFLQGSGTFEQTITGLTSGKTYQVVFAVSQRQNKSGGQPGQTFNVTIDGGVIGSFEPPQGSAGYADLTAGFTATAAAHTLAFVGTNLNGGDNTAFFDHIRLNGEADPIRPDIRSIAVSASGEVTLSWDSDADGSYTIFYSTNLVDGTWEPLKTGISGSESGAMETVTNSNEGTQFFFKVESN